MRTNAPHGTGGIRTRILLVLIALVPIAPTVAATTDCSTPLGPCEIAIDPDGEEPVTYAMGEAPPSPGCDEGDDCCFGCWIEIGVCVLDRVTPYYRASGGVGAPVATLWVQRHYECTTSGCTGEFYEPNCALYQYGETIADRVGLRDADGDGEGDTVFVQDLQVGAIPA